MRLNSSVTISGSKVVLVPYLVKHVPKYHKWMQNEELLFLTASEPLTLQEEYAMQKSWREDENKCTFIILDKDDFETTNDDIKSMIGDVNLYLNDPEVSEIEVMIADREHRSKGKGKESLLFMLRYGLEDLGVKKYVAKIKMKNYASIKLFESIGFCQTSSSNIFQEVEMTCSCTEQWKNELISQTKSYKMGSTSDL